jgi:predicted ester cyclase
MGYLSDVTRTDSFARIPFYRSYENQAWELLGAFVVTDVQESGQLMASDGTKYKILSVKLRTASKI